MRNQIVRWMRGIAFLATFTLVFIQCEMGHSETVPVDDFDVSTRDEASPQQLCACLTADFATEDLSEAEKNALIFMREEEKLARDIYLGLYEQWNLPAFRNIARAEQVHMDAVLCLINKYGLEDPVGEDQRGAFKNEALLTLYGQLKEQGAESLHAALQVGATIEDVDIRDLMQNVADTEIDNEDILAVFNALTKGSRNHLRAFNGHLKNAGLTYAPQYLSTDIFESIINSEWEVGNGICGSCPNIGAGDNIDNSSNTPCIYNGNVRRGPGRNQGNIRTNCIYRNNNNKGGGN